MNNGIHGTMSLLVSLVGAMLAVVGPLTAHGGVASCQTGGLNQSASCTEFASKGSIPVAMEKACIMGGTKNARWVKNPCLRQGAIGQCEVLRKDMMTQVAYCYRMQGLPVKERLEACRKSCRGIFTVY